MRLTNPLKGIIEDMAHLKDLYNFTSYVEKTEYTDKVLRFNSNHLEAWRQYGKAKKMFEKDAINLGRMASDKHYITYAPLNDHDGPPNKLIVDTAGLELLDRTVFGKIPKGLWLAWAEKNSKLINLIWLVIGVVIGNIDKIISMF